MAEGVRAGVPVFWQAFGDGPRRALALHCGLARSGAWREVAARVETPLTVIAPDLPGHGNSGGGEAGTDYAASVMGVAESFLSDDDRAVDLIGHSLGGVVALRLALAHPERVRTLTLVEPTLFPAALGDPSHRAYAAEAAPFHAALEAGDAARATALFTGTWGFGAETPEHIRAYCEARIHLVTAARPLNEDEDGAALAPGGLESLAVPVLLISGARSPKIVHAIAEAIAARLPDVGVATVPGAGHMLPVTHPAQVAGLWDVNLTRE